MCVVYCSASGKGFFVHVQNTNKFLPLDVVLDFGKSKNLKIPGSWGLKRSVQVAKGACVVAAKLEPKYSKSATALQWIVNATLGEPDPKELAAAQSEFRARVAQHCASTLKLHRKLLDAKRAPFSGAAVLETLRATNATFVDIFFPPAGLSVGEEAADSPRIVWRRPIEFIDWEESADASSSRRGGSKLDLARSSSSGTRARVVEVFDQGIQASDIVQGELGNCWFMCALAAICEFPHLVDRLFLTAWSKDDQSSKHRSSEEGCYELQFCVDSQWSSIMVDDYFPCKAPGGGPIFSRTNGHEIWVLLVEKAYAKLQGSYHDCRLGDPAEGLRDLTGSPTIKVIFEEEDVSFDDVHSWDRNDCIICASTPGTDTMTETGGKPGANQSGLVPGHAYTVVQARRIKVGKYAGAEVVQVRNPWGSFEWGGSWSDDSPELAACRDELEDDGIDSNDSVGDDGMFWCEL